MVPEFQCLGEFPIDLQMRNNGSGIKNTLLQNNACYHKSCFKKFTKQQLQKLKTIKLKHQLNDEASSSNNSSISDAKRLGSAEPRSLSCVFCEKGEDRKQSLNAAAPLWNNQVNSQEDMIYVAEKTDFWRKMGQYWSTKT